MGVIFGYISLTDKPLNPATPEAMRKANSFWGPDGEGLWEDDHAALGSLIMLNTPEAIFEKQPIHFENNTKVLVATARIDNRDDLCRIFDIPLSARDLYPDSYYIRLAYEKWGEGSPDHLIGDWSFAVWDKIKRKLFVARDHHGIMACYYYKGPDFFVFSSSLKGILCLPQVPKKVNEYKIAQILVNWNEGGPPTCYEDIFRLPPAHTLNVDNGLVTTNRYWYLEHTPEIRLKNDQEYIDMFRELYTEAVRCRLRSYRPIGATLSGGLDSGSVCILAAQELAKYGKRLPAFTAVPLYDVPWPKNRIGDEGPLALALAEKLGNVDVTLCNAENISPLGGVEKLFIIHDQLLNSLTNSYWISDILLRSKQFGYTTILIAQFGNLTINWYKSYNFLGKFYHFAVDYFQYFKLLTNLWERDYIISEYLIKRVSLKEKIKKYELLNYYRYKLNKTEIRKYIFNNGGNTIGDIWFESGLFYKLEIRDPTIDLRLFKFILGVPISLLKNNRLIDNNFRKYFNSQIIYRKIRGIQGIDINMRLKYNLSEDQNKLIQKQNLYMKDFSSNLKHKDLLKRYMINLFTSI